MALTAACGARWTDTQRAEAAAIERGPAREAQPGGEAPDTTAGAGAETLLSDGGAVDGPRAAVGSGVEPGSAFGLTDAPSAKPCAARSTAPGVTDEELSIGAIETVSGGGGPLGASHLAAVRAYVAYRNAQGGVCGRQLKLLDADDGLDSGRNRALTIELDPKVIGFVGGNAGGGNGGAGVIKERNIPIVGISASELLDEAPSYFSVSPRTTRGVPTPKFRYLASQGVTKAAVVYISAGPSTAEAKRQISLIEAVGIDVVLDLPVPLSTLSWDSTARSVASSGADYLQLIAADSQSAAMARAMADARYQLKSAEYVTAYGSIFARSAGPAAEGAVSWIFALPDEDGGVVPEHALFLRWMGKVAPSASRDTFAASGWSGTEALVEAIEALPGPITREALLTQLRNTGRFDAHGFTTAVELGKKIPSDCSIAMTYQQGKWRRLTPATGFLC